MGKNTSAVWNGAITEKVFDNTYEFSLSEKIGVLYPTTNSGKNRGKIDETFTNWSVGNPTYSTYQRYTGDNINNIAKTDTKITHKIGLIKYDTYSSYTVQPFNSISDYISYSGETTYQISGNDIRIVNNFDYSDIYVYPKINLKILNKENNATENVNNLTIAQFKEKIDNAETGKDYYIENISYRIYSRKTPNVGLSNQYCIMSIIDIDDIQFICGAGLNGIFNYNAFRYYQNLGGIVINNNGSTKIPTQCYNIKEDLTYTRVDTLNYNSFLKADYKIVMEYIATFGFWFYDGEKFYLPEMKNNQTTGRYFPEEVLEYIDSENKEWDNSANIDNKLPSSDTNDNDSEVDMTVGAGYTAGGMVNYYEITSDNLEMLSKLMSNVDVVGTKNLMPNLISLKAFPFDFSKLGNGVSKTIKLGGVEMTDSIAGTATGVSVDSTFTFIPCCDTVIEGKYGSLSSPHFLDFSPYTQVELILPLAGSVLLPDNAMYKPLNVVYVYDIVNGTAICVVKSNGTIIATIPCTISMDIPFSAINVGAKTSAMISNITNVAQNIATLGVSIGTGNVVGGISSGIGTVGSIAQSVMNSNQNYIEKFGRTGDSCDFWLVKKAYIKYTRPVAIIPDSFGQSTGYLCNVTKKLSECSGFTVCENPVINCNATENEKQEIKRLLETGVIL